MSTASSKSLDKQQNAESKFGEEGTSSASQFTSTRQQQTAGDSSVAEEAMVSLPAALINHQNGGPSTEDQLRKQIARLEDDINQLKLDQGPNREAIKHTLLRDESARLHEENLTLRVELEVAQESVRFLEKKLEKHQVLGSELERCKQLMQKAIDGLSTGLGLSNNESSNLGLATKAVPFSASLLPQQSVSSGPVETATRFSSLFASIGKLRPSQGLISPPRAPQTDGNKGDISSSAFPTSSTDTNTSTKFGLFGLPISRPSQGLSGPPRAPQTDGNDGDISFSAFPNSSTNTDTSFKFGTLGLSPSRPSQLLSSPPRASQTDQPPTITPFAGTASASTFPAFHPLATKASSTVTSIDSNGKAEPAATPKVQGILGKSTMGSGTSDPYTSFGGSSSSLRSNLFQANNEPTIGEIGGVQASGKGKT